eukprot:maker-scaffold_44-snap-gene-0.47-mRNA-1 protein AED:0.00 eAED:0.00 QI:90/1/1/1/1/1/2/64/391
MSSEQKIDNSQWILPVLGSSICWAVSDTLCDICIEENASDSEEDEDFAEKKPLFKPELNPPPSPKKKHRPTQIDGEQDVAVAGLVSLVFSYFLSFNRLSKASPGSFSWSFTEDIEWWLASVGGMLLFLHYLYVLWAYDSAPSTVINPLVQMSSVSVLLFSFFPSLLTNSTFIKPLDLFCYFIIVLGGILPLINNEWKKLLTRKFWKKPFLKYILYSELTVGFYDILLSYCLQTSVKKEKFKDLAASTLENEFFYLAWCWFSITFVFSFTLIPRLNGKIVNLQYVQGRKTLIYSALSQVLTLLAFYFSAFAYARFYQASVVHAAESSLEQGFNLLFAFVLKTFFNVGRNSAVEDLKSKVLSCCVITIGLFVIAYQDELDSMKKQYFEYRNGV